MILHILNTDLRRSRFSLLAFLAGLALLAAVLNQTSGWQQHGINAALWLVFMLFAACVLTANVVLADSPAENEAQWLGRPISWRQLLVAKLLYIFLAVWLPLSFVAGVMWRASFTAGQAFWAGLEIGMYAAPPLLLVAALAAASKKRSRCIGYFVALWGCVVVSAMGKGLLRGIWQPPSLMITPETFPFVVPLTALFIGLLLTCWQFRVRRAYQTLLALALLVILLPHIIPKVRSKPSRPMPPPAALSVTSANAPGDGQTLHHNLRVQGLLPGQFVALRDLRIRFRNKGYNRRSDGYSDFAAAIILAQLPAGSSLTHDDKRLGRTIGKFLSHAGQVGPLKGTMTFALSQLTRVGELALETNATLTASGYHATVTQLDPSAGRSVSIKHSQPQLLFTSDSQVHRPNTRSLIHVAYDPAHKRARIMLNHAYRYSESIWPMLEIGSARFQLEPGEDRLYIFRVAELDLHEIAFDFPEHRIQGPPSAESAAHPLATDPATILADIPLPSALRTAAYDRLRDELTDAHLAALVNALPRDPELAQFLRKPDWVEAARAPLLTKLAQRRPRTPQALLIHAASLPDADPADLHWHLIHSHKNVEGLFRELMKRPDFDADATLATAWARHRVLGKTDLLNEALAAGLPGALDVAVRDEIKHGNARLSRFVDGFTGERADFSAWLMTHAPSLRYDPATRRYR